MQDPVEILNEYGADAMRLYLITSPVVHGDNLAFKKQVFYPMKFPFTLCRQRSICLFLSSTKTSLNVFNALSDPPMCTLQGVFEVIRSVFLPWYNAYRFLVQNVIRHEKETGTSFDPAKASSPLLCQDHKCRQPAFPSSLSWRSPWCGQL